jgi:uncharacterized protein YjdB
MKNFGKLTEIVLIVAVIVCSMAGCDSSPEEQTHVTGVSLNKTTTILTVGGSETLLANVIPSNADNKSVTWSSSNSAIASVSQGGTVTGVAAGSATITVRTADGGFTSSCAVTVNTSSVSVDPIKPDFTPLYFYVDENGDFSETDAGRTVVAANDQTGVVLYSDDIESDVDRVGFSFEDKTIIFYFEKNNDFPASVVLSDSEDSYYGSFSPYDLVSQNYGLSVEHGEDKLAWSNIALNKGKISQYKDDPEFTASQNLRMRNIHTAMSVYISLYDFLLKNGTLQARSILSLAGKVASFFSPTVDNIFNELLNVFKGGDLVEAVGNIILELTGANTIFGAVDYILSVISIPVTGVSLSKTNVSLVIGSTETLTPIITPSNATNQNITWSSSNPDVARVSTGGTVTGVGVGTATITVTTVDGDKKANCTVNVTGNIVGSGTEENPYQLTENIWADGSITSSANGSAVWYSINVTNGNKYYIWFNDGDDGNGTKTLDILVSFGSGSGSLSEERDSGWTIPGSFTAGSSGTRKIRVIPYYIGNTGTYAIAYTTSSTRPGSSVLSPLTPTNVTGHINNFGTVTLSWDAVPGATSYNIYRGIIRNGSLWAAFKLYQSGVTRTGYIDSEYPITYGTYFVYRVTAVNSYGESGMSVSVP